MSASTVSVGANPSVAARRRLLAAAVAVEMKQNIDAFNDTTVSPNVDNTNLAVGGLGNDKITSGGGGGGGVSNKDLSHSIRGEVVLERSKDKKSSQLPNSNPPTRSKNRKVPVVPPKPPKPRWHTVIRILTKNFLVLLVLVGLVQMVTKLVVNSGNEGKSGSNLMGFSDMEGRLAVVESSLKTTTKMLQVQLEVVDKKIDGEVGNLRREINKKIEDNGIEIDTQLRKLDERSESLEMGLSELRSKDLLVKDDLMGLYDELKKVRGDEGVLQSELSLDDIRNLAREIVEKEIEKHAADGLGRVDYAMASGGAVILKHSEPFIVGKLANWLSVSSSQGVHSNADKMLKPSFGEPGQCFPVKGSSGFVVIRLRTAIVADALTLEHVDKSVAYDQSSAPKHCRVFGWLQGQQGGGIDFIDGEKMFLLTEFTYDLDKSNAQTFNVLDSARFGVIDTVRFDFSSNHGSPSHTCIYRLRVHGHEPKSVPLIAVDS